MGRLTPIAAEDYTPDQKRIADMIANQRKAKVRGPFGVLLHTPEICELFANFVDLSLDEEQSRIPLRLKELAIITVGRVYGSDYEWFIHAARAVRVGVAEDIVEAIRTRKRPDFEDSNEALVYDMTLDMVENRTLGDALYARAVAAFGEPALVELVALIGFYIMIAAFLCAFDVDAPEGGPAPLVP